MLWLLFNLLFVFCEKPAASQRGSLWPIILARLAGRELDNERLWILSLVYQLWRHALAHFYNWNIVSHFLRPQINGEKEKTSVDGFIVVVVLKYEAAWQIVKRLVFNFLSVKMIQYCLTYLYCHVSRNLLRINFNTTRTGLLCRSSIN